MKKYRVILSFHYEVEAESEEAAEYAAIDAIKRDLPDNAAPLEAEVTEVKA